MWRSRRSLRRVCGRRCDAAAPKGRRRPAPRRGEAQRGGESSGHQPPQPSPRLDRGSARFRRRFARARAGRQLRRPKSGGGTTEGRRARRRADRPSAWSGGSLVARSWRRRRPDLPPPPTHAPLLSRCQCHRSCAAPGGRAALAAACCLTQTARHLLATSGSSDPLRAWRLRRTRRAHPARTDTVARPRREHRARAVLREPVLAVHTPWLAWTTTILWRVPCRHAGRLAQLRWR